MCSMYCEMLLFFFFQVIVPAMGFDIVVICPAFEDICWVSDVNGVSLGQWLVVADIYI